MIFFEATPSLYQIGESKLWIHGAFAAVYPKEGYDKRRVAEQIVNFEKTVNGDLKLSLVDKFLVANGLIDDNWQKMETREDSIQPPFLPCLVAQNLEGELCWTSDFDRMPELNGYFLVRLYDQDDPLLLASMEPQSRSAFEILEGRDVIIVQGVKIELLTETTFDAPGIFASCNIIYSMVT